MKRLAFCLSSAAALALTFASSAGADGIVAVELAARVGAATSPGWVANPFALGFGARAGASFHGFYGGITAMYYLGGSFGASGFHTVLIGLEGGYTLKVGPVLLRPQVGVGDGSFSQTASDGVNNPPISTLVGNVYLEPGVVVMIPIGSFFVGADANALILPAFSLANSDGMGSEPAKTYLSFSAHAQVGVRF
jgi:hypothetical protein